MNRFWSWFTPGRVIRASIAIVVAAIIFLPTQNGNEDQRLTSFNTTPYGTKGLYDALSRIGFHVQRRTTSLADSLSTAPIYVILDPSVDVTSEERAFLRDAVQRGAGLLMATNNDSLTRPFGFVLENPFKYLLPATAFAATGATIPWRLDDDSVTNHPIEISTNIFDNDRNAIPYPRGVALHKAGTFEPFMTVPDSVAPETVVQHVVMLGTTHGLGRVVLLSTPPLLSNQILRGGPPAVAVVRALEWMDGHARPIVFDEYHQGFGTHADIMRAIQAALFTTRPGWLLCQLIAATLLLLWVASLRPIPPVATATITRRSPLEHASALAHAYAQTGAWTLAVDYLIRGLRRRHSLGVSRGKSHDAYLDALHATFPATAADVATLRRMLHATHPEHVRDAGTVVARIETAFPTHA